ncbi:hypothetical protein PG984_005481 [Apiospora sp. TS-2023a]
MASTMSATAMMGRNLLYRRSSSQEGLMSLRSAEVVDRMCNKLLADHARFILKHAVHHDHSHVTPPPWDLEKVGRNVVDKVERLIEIWRWSRPLGQIGESTRRELERAVECLLKQAAGGGNGDGIGAETIKNAALPPSAPHPSPVFGEYDEDSLPDALVATLKTEEDVSFNITGKKLGEIEKLALTYPEACEAVADSIHAVLQRYDVEVGYPARWSQQSAK